LWYSNCFTKANNKNMISAAYIRKTLTPVTILFLCLAMIAIQGCKKKRPWDMNEILFKKTHNKVFKKIDLDGYDTVFRKVLDSLKPELNNYKILRTYYTNNNEPVFIANQLSTKGLEAMVNYYRTADCHGFNSKMFQADVIDSLLGKFYGSQTIKNPKEAYNDIAELELYTANSLINYSNDLQYGIVNPKKIFSRYFMATKEPDSATAMQVFQIKDVKAYLDSIQPKDPQYLALQHAYINHDTVGGLSVEESKRVLLVNMERLRWKNKPAEHRYIIVNIPDFRLNVIDSGHSVLNMKVCVGQGRNMQYAKTLMHFDDTDRVDNPNPHETPMLNSIVHSVEVNPIWNIPHSIASKEIIVEEQKDRFYMANKSINVYKNGKKIDDPEDIDWASADISDYDFRQAPGDDNSLGKIKFLFNNKSNVYLHDTPAKRPFGRPMRAVSHGCVRLEQPLQLAHNLFGDGKKYDLIAKDMASNNPDPTDINLNRKIPVYITYVTCWADSTGTLQYRGDVYGKDIVLFANLEKKTAD
jgi:L,D-transpeptidase YcbB